MSVLSPSSENHCAIDFGTSNSAVAIADPGSSRGIRLVAVEGAQVTMPTAVFFDSEQTTRSYGRAAIAAYVEGHDGRLMRSLKSILGSALVTESTHLGDGIAVRYLDVIASFLKQLKDAAERAAGLPLRQVVLGRPVHFVDDDPVADRRAEDALRDAALSIGFTDVSFQFEPLAAAQDYGSGLDSERLVLVADIGGGTSDFTAVRIGGPGSATGAVLANHGIHVAGTDFDQRIELDAILPLMGYRGRTPEGREVPHGVYHDLATWHLINGVYGPRRVAELRSMRWFYDDPVQYQRLMRVIDARLGHGLVAAAENTKIALSDVERCEIPLDDVEPGLAASFDRDRLARSLQDAIDRIVAAAHETIRLAGVAPQAVAALYLTGGSTGLRTLSGRLATGFPAARIVFGDPFASVAAGLGIEAARRYGRPPVEARGG